MTRSFGNTRENLERRLERERDRSFSLVWNRSKRTTFAHFWHTEADEGGVEIGLWSPGFHRSTASPYIWRNCWRTYTVKCKKSYGKSMLVKRTLLGTTREVEVHAYFPRMIPSLHNKLPWQPMHTFQQNRHLRGTRISELNNFQVRSKKWAMNTGWPHITDNPLRITNLKMNRKVSFQISAVVRPSLCTVTLGQCGEIDWRTRYIQHKRVENRRKDVTYNKQTIQDKVKTRNHAG